MLPACKKMSSYSENIRVDPNGDSTNHTVMPHIQRKKTAGAPKTSNRKNLKTRIDLEEEKVPLTI